MELEIIGIEVGQARVFADHARLDRGTGQKQARARAMVGPAAAVFLHSAAELGVRHQPHAAVVAAGLEGCKEPVDRIRQVGQQVGVRRGLAGVRVEAVQADIENARAEAAGDQAGNELSFCDRPASGRCTAFGPSSKSRSVSTAVNVCTCRR